MRKATLFNIKQSVIRWASLLVFVLGASLQAQAQDCPPVTVFCQDLHTSFMADACMVEVWAKDFISKINNHETSLDDYIISFEEDSEVMSRVYESLDGNTYEVTIWITSRCDASLKTRCVVTLDINDNTGLCPRACCIANEWTGWAVSTCTADSVNIIAGKFDDQVAIMYDVRLNSQSPRGDDWANPFTQGETALPELSPASWTLNNLGQIFGIATDDIGTVYLASSDVYARNYNTLPQVNKPCGSIYRAAPPSYNATLFASLPVMCQELNGIGNIAYDYTNDQIFATNLEDGRIYRINSSGATIQTFDPFAQNPDAVGVANGIVSQNEQIWGIGINVEAAGVKIYFPRTISNTVKEIWSITLNADGSMPATGSERREVAGIPGSAPRITDIAFSQDRDRMLIGTRGTTNRDLAHNARAYSLERNVSGVWTLETKYFSGAFIRDVTDNPIFQGNDGENSAGGVSFGFVESNGVVNSSCDDLIWITSNLMSASAVEQSNPGFSYLYGLQGIEYSGNNSYSAANNPSSETDIFVDFDGEYTFGPKGNIGDVEIISCAQSSINQVASAFISGSIRVGDDIPAKGIEVNIVGENMLETQLSDENGLYAFRSLERGESYQLSAINDENHVDGVSTLDLILIQNHILGKTQLEGLDIVAADINNSGSITSLDLVELRQLILGKKISFSNNTSWKYLEKNLINKSADLLNIETEYNIDEFSENMLIEFSGVKIGDVNGTNSVAGLAASRSKNTVTLGESYSENNYTLSGTNEDHIRGIQFSIEMPKGVELSSVSSELPGFSEANYSVNENVLKVSWFRTNPIVISLDQDIIRLNFEKKISAGSVQLNSELEGEIYDTDFLSHSIEIDKINFKIDDLSVTPNPFSSAVKIDYKSEEDGQSLVTLFNISGKIVLSRAIKVNKGNNTIVLNDGISELNAGMYFLEIRTNSGQKLAKIIKAN